MDNKKIDKPIKILLIGPSKGGGVATIHNEVNSLLRKEKHFSCQSIGSYPPLNRRNLFKGANYIKLYAEMVLRILSFRPNVIYLQIAQTGYFHQSIFLLVGKLFRRKTIAHFHAKPNVSATGRPFAQKLILLSQWYIETMIVLTESAKESLVHHGWKTPIHVIPNFVITSDYPKKLKPLNERKYDILYLGRMHLDKGIVEILRIADLLNKRFFIFIGDFADKNFECKFKEKIVNMQNVRWLGPIYDNSKINYIEETKILLMPTKRDVFPLTIIECLMCGVIPFVHPVGSIPDIVKNGYSGTYIGLNCPEKTATQIDVLLNDKSSSQAMSNKCRQVALKYYTSDAVKDKLIKAIML